MSNSPEMLISELMLTNHVPSTWKIRRFKHVANVVVQKPSEADQDLSYVGLEHIESWTGKLLGVADEMEDSTSNVCRSGDVLFGKLRPYLAKVFMASGEFRCSSEFLVLRSQYYHPEYLKYVLLSADFIDLVNSSTYGARMPRASWDFIGDIRMPVPPTDIQIVVASFLDHEVTKLDALVDKKQRLIDLLQEKRQAFTTQAVTEGLDHSVPMKDLGIPWLGKVPAHWTIKRIKHVSHFVTSGSRGWAEYYSDDGELFIRVGNISRQKTIELDLSDVQYVSPPQGSEGERTKVQSGDVLLAITGATIGSVAIIPTGLGTAYVNQHTALVRPKKRDVDSRWLAYSLIASYTQTLIDLLSRGGTKEGLSLEDVRDFTVLVPPRDEQELIVSHIDHKGSLIDDASAKLHRQIELLLEYRQALISAAVTGQIDVRQYVGNEAEVAIS